MYLMVATSPRDRAQCCDLSANGQVENSANLFRRHRMHNPPEHNHANADRDYTGNVDLGRPRERAIWTQDPGILDRGFSPWRPLTKGPAHSGP
jgi:hypothetical protein